MVESSFFTVIKSSVQNIVEEDTCSIMGILYIEQTDDATYNCKCCGFQIAKSNKLKSIHYQHPTFGLCFCFGKTMNTKMFGNFPMQIIEMNSYALIDDFPIPDSDNEYGSHLHCKKCNDLLGWAVKNKLFILIKNKIE